MRSCCSVLQLVHQAVNFKAMMDRYWLIFIFKIIWKSWHCTIYLWTPNAVEWTSINWKSGLSPLCAILTGELLIQKQTFWECCTFPSQSTPYWKNTYITTTINYSQLCPRECVECMGFKVKKMTIALVSMLVLQNYSSCSSQNTITCLSWSNFPKVSHQSCPIWLYLN